MVGTIEPLYIVLVDDHIIGIEASSIVLWSRASILLPLIMVLLIFFPSMEPFIKLRKGFSMVEDQGGMRCNMCVLFDLSKALIFQLRQ